MDVNEESDGNWDPEAERRHLQVKGKQRAWSPTDQEMDGTTDAAAEKERSSEGLRHRQVL